MESLRRRVKTSGLMVLAMLPIASVAFAAQSSLKVAQVRHGHASDKHLAKGNTDSEG